MWPVLQPLYPAFIAPAFTSLKSGGEVTSAAYTIKGVLDQARTYAMANNTYAWVGLFEEDANSPTPAVAGNGRLVVSVVASTDGTNVYGSNTGTIDPIRLIQIGKLIKINNVHLPLFAIGLGTGDTFDKRPTLQNDPAPVHYNYSRFGELNAATPNTAPYTTPYNFQYPVGNPAQPRNTPLTNFFSLTRAVKTESMATLTMFGRSLKSDCFKPTGTHFPLRLVVRGHLQSPTAVTWWRFN